MTLMEKILASLLAVVLVCFGGFVIYKEHQVAAMQTSITNSMVAQENLINNLQRSSSQFATSADLNAFAAQENVNLTAIKANLDSLNASVVAINSVVVQSSGQNQTNVPSSGTKPNPNPPPTTTTVSCNGGTASCPGPIDTYKFTQNIQTLALNEDFATVQVPIGSVSFDASQPKPWSETIYPRTYDIVNTIGANSTTTQMIVYNQLSITANGKTQTVPITSSKLVQQVPAPSFSWFNPRLMLSMNGGINLSEATIKGEATPSIGLQVMSYGSSKSSPSISVLGVGVGYEIVSKKATIIVNPIGFNIGKVIGGGIVDNTFIGPSIQVDTKGDVSVGAGLSVGF